MDGFDLVEANLVLEFAKVLGERVSMDLAKVGGRLANIANRQKKSLKAKRYPSDIHYVAPVLLLCY